MTNNYGQPQQPAYAQPTAKIDSRPYLESSNAGDNAMVSGTTSFCRLFECVHGQALRDDMERNNSNVAAPYWSITVDNAQLMPNPATGGQSNFELYAMAKVNNYVSADGVHHFSAKTRATNENFENANDERNPNNVFYPKPFFYLRLPDGTYKAIDLEGEPDRGLPVHLLVECCRSKPKDRAKKPTTYVKLKAVYFDELSYWTPETTSAPDASAWGFNVVGPAAAPQAPAQPQVAQPVFASAPQPMPQAPAAVQPVPVAAAVPPGTLADEVPFPPTPAELDGFQAELGALMARAATGSVLSPEEKARMESLQHSLTAHRQGQAPVGLGGGIAG
ncbi:hypothetical protein [Caniella muris]|uniref:hypothetical protein n=1 Tax=Caniella muris TaxID=2941502 RepID=UPI00203B7DC1|nr:hypothetical protein [Caniella muris]